MKTYKFFYVYVVVAVSMLYNTAFPQWTEQATGLPDSVQIPCISAVNQSTAWAVGCIYTWRGPLPYQDFIKTTDGGTTWTVGTISGVPKLYFSNIHALDDSIAWVAMNLMGANSGGRIFKTTDGGATWIQQKTAFLGRDVLIGFVHFFDADNGVCMGNADDSFTIYTTKDGGGYWNLVPQSNIPDRFHGEWGGLWGNFVASGDSALWFGTYMGRIFRTTDRGMTWDAYMDDTGIVGRSGRFAFQNTDIGLAISQDASTVMAAKTTDGGMTWTLLPKPPPIFGSISYVPGTINSYVIGSESGDESQPGSAYTLDGGETWTMVDSVDHHGASFADPSTGWSASSYGSMIYKWIDPPLFSATDVERKFEISQIPNQFELHQNYPNPFNPTTMIRYEVSKTDHVVLKVINLMGQEICTLVNEEKPIGSYEVMWNSKDKHGQQVASGVYLYKLEARNFVQTRKMVLLQ